MVRFQRRGALSFNYRSQCASAVQRDITSLEGKTLLQNGTSRTTGIGEESLLRRKKEGHTLSGGHLFRLFKRIRV